MFGRQERERSPGGLVECSNAGLSHDLSHGPLSVPEDGLTKEEGGMMNAPSMARQVA